MTSDSITRRDAVALVGSVLVGCSRRAGATNSSNVPAQPYFANVKRAVDALAKLGAPIASRDAGLISTFAQSENDSSVAQTEAVLDKYTLARLALDAGGPISVETGGAARTLVEQGWRVFLVRIDNAGRRAHSIMFPGINRSVSGMAGIGGMAQRSYLLDTLNKAPLVERMWWQGEIFGATPMRFGQTDLVLLRLSGLPYEYHVLQLYSRDRGVRVARLALRCPNPDNFWYGGVSNEFEFQCLPTKEVKLRVRDSDGLGCMASLTIKDTQGRVYPLQAMRLAPDMSFHEHIYRGDGETIRLPDGEYVVDSSRGPEYLRGSDIVSINRGTDSIDIQLRRWVDPSQWGWYSGDTHIHAAGCAHYQVPTEGVTPETIIRHVRGEALSIGQVLTWGPSWYYQKQFFSGHAQSPAAALEHPALQAANNVTWQTRATPKDRQSLLRYDVEVSGFPSSICGHLVLLRLKEQDYPGTRLIEDWPSWNLPILKWAKAQGAVVGYSHCALGMIVESMELPNYEIPAFDSIGTNEAIVDIAHRMVDFLSGCNFFPVAELNAWYHMLNCGFRLAMVGETDYPCATGERPGFGRTYVRLDSRPLDNAGYVAWVEGLQLGHLYCGDGRSHFLDFRVQGNGSGEDLNLSAPGVVKVEAIVAARLEAEPKLDVETLGAGPLRRWHLENARIGKSREVAVELIINGVAADKAIILADGTLRKVRFDAALARSSWVALRILTSSHTHPVFVQVDGKPIRASKRSAQWCRDCVDKLWKVKSPFIRESERPEAAEAFDHARKVYDSIADECELE